MEDLHSELPWASFAVYAPDFEVRNNLTGEVWSFKQSAAYSKAGFEQVNESISISDILLGFEGLRPGPWLIDLKRVDPTKAYDPDAPLFDPHGLFRDADHSH